MIVVTGTETWGVAHPGAVIGLLEIAGVDNRAPSPQLNERKREVEARLRREYAGFERPDFLELPVLRAYRAYYKRFKKTYHVQLQVESLVLKGRNLPDVSPLVDANFLAEMETFVLTAGHDADRLEPPVVIDVSLPGDEIAPMGGRPRAILPGDMVMRDRGAISCSILYGQDDRSPITPATTHALYVAYAPPGVPDAAVKAQLERILENVRLFAPQVQVLQNRLLKA